MNTGRANRSTLIRLALILCTSASLLAAASLPRAGAADDDNAQKSPAAGVAPSGANNHPTNPDEINERLANVRVPVEFDGAPLRDVIDFIGDRANLNTFIDRLALDSAGIAQDAPVTVKLRHPVSAAQALSLVLRSVNPALAYSIDNEVVIISTNPEAQAGAAAAAAPDLETRVYDVADLVKSDVSGDALVNLLTSSATPDAWKSEPGGARATLLGTRLVVTAPAPTQDAVNDLLTKVRHPTPTGVVPEKGQQTTEKTESK